MSAGFIKIYRQLTEWEWYSDVNVFKLFMHCLLKANHKDNKWQGITIEKGSFVTSYENLSKETGLTIQQVRTALNKLKSTSEITYKSTSQYSIISIKNWNMYQEDNTQINKQITNNQQTNNKQITTNKNDKNEKNEKNDKNIKKEKKEFDLFFKEYPLKIDEYKTFTLYSTLINEKIVTLDDLMQGVERYKKYLTAKNQTAIKQPYNWLKDMSWKNEYKLDEEEERKRKVPPKEKERKGEDAEEYIYNPFAIL